VKEKAELDKEYEDLKAKIDVMYSSENWTQQDREVALKFGDRLNAIDDRLYEIEQELYDIKKEEVFIKQK